MQISFFTGTIYLISFCRILRKEVGKMTTTSSTGYRRLTRRLACNSVELVSMLVTRLEFQRPTEIDSRISVNHIIRRPCSVPLQSIRRFNGASKLLRRCNSIITIDASRRRRRARFVFAIPTPWKEIGDIIISFKSAANSCACSMSYRVSFLRNELKIYLIPLNVSA